MAPWVIYFLNHFKVLSLQTRPGSWKYFTIYREVLQTLSSLLYTSFWTSNLSRPPLVSCACICSLSKHLFSICHILRIVWGSENSEIKKEKNPCLPGAHIKDQSKQTFGVHWDPGEWIKVLHFMQKKEKGRGEGSFPSGNKHKLNLN